MSVCGCENVRHLGVMDLHALHGNFASPHCVYVFDREKKRKIEEDSVTESAGVRKRKKRKRRREERERNVCVSHTHI